VPTMNRLFSLFLSSKTKEKSERFILIIAIASFVLHLAIILLVDLNLIALPVESELLSNPIAAIYTPFSFILIYEVYLLIYYLPKSFTTYISKQYEIISLIIIRRIFKDLANLELSKEWFEIKDDLQFTYDLIASIALFLLLYLFHRQGQLQKKMAPAAENSVIINRFIQFKKWIAVLLVPTMLALAVYNLSAWAVSLRTSTTGSISLKDSNNIFFDEFFTLLIIVDVLLLLLSFFHTDQFHKVIRNSGFIISTILIRLSFTTDGIINTLLILSAIIFGLVILTIHNLYEKQLYPTNSN
jgi:hypothetical protein